MSASQVGHALYFVSPGKVEVRSEPISRREGEVRVESRLMGISHGTEMLFFRGEIPEELPVDPSLACYDGSLSFPIKYGYTNTGVSENGERIFAFFPHQDHFYANTRDVVVLPHDIPFEDAVFLANMEAAVGIVHDAAPLVGETILILGQGVLGLLVAEILRLGDAGRVITVEPLPLRRKASERIGCVALPSGADTAEQVNELTEGAGVDIAINVSSSAEGLQLAIDTLACEGKVVEASWYGIKEVALRLGSAFHRKRLAICCSQVSTIKPALMTRWSRERRLHLVVELLERIRPSKYITHRISLGEAQRAFELIQKSVEETIQVVLEP
jgi:threonine dehydrogenase-like Zn-dependent dehydrogenase